MTPAPRELQDFGTDARRAVALAEVEARELGHERIGTEHLLLGLLADETSDAARLLAELRITLEATRSKVREAVGGPSGPVAPTPGAFPLSPRAVRALGRSVRFCHSRHLGVVSSEQLLWGVLDVEGTAGQVLRGLGIEIEALRATLESEALPAETGSVVPSEDAPEDAAVPPAMCPYCSSDLHNDLVFRTVTALGEGREAHGALVFSCGTCNRVLGVH